MSQGAVLGGDPRNAAHPVTRSAEPIETQLLHAIHDRSVAFEEYIYYAKITRAEEKISNERYVAAVGPKTFKSVLKNRFSKGTTGFSPHDGDDNSNSPTEANPASGEKSGFNDEKGVVPQQNLGGVSDSDWHNASRAVRTAGWSGIFYLITTDILGPFSVP